MAEHNRQVMNKDLEMRVEERVDYIINTLKFSNIRIKEAMQLAKQTLMWEKDRIKQLQSKLKLLKRELKREGQREPKLCKCVNICGRSIKKINDDFNECPTCGRLSLSQPSLKVLNDLTVHKK